MPNSNQTTLANAGPVAFEDILDELEELTRAHHVIYRVGVGRVLLERFWGGDGRAYGSRDANKEARFALFFEKCGEQLARYGITQRQARDNIRAAIVVDQLPASVGQRLFWTQVLEIARLSDPTARAEVALTAVEQDWSVAQLRLAVDAAQGGGVVERAALVDAVAGAEVEPPVEDNDPAPAAGRMVGRAERLVEEARRWRGHWGKVDASRLRQPQRERLRLALAALREEVVALEGVVGAADTPSQ